MKFTQASFLLLLLFPFLLPISGAAQSWSQMNTTGNIAPRANASSIFIPQRNEFVVFGGTTSNGRTHDVWALDLDTGNWREIVSNSATQPGNRHTQNAVYDQANDRMVIFSGQGSGLFNDVWAFSFPDSSWTNLSPNGNTGGVPLRRYGGVTEFDSLNNRFVTFAGFTTSGRFDDTWSFDLGGNAWSNVSQSVFPTKRCLFNSALAHDRRKMVIYGGQGNGNFDDIWSCDLDSYAWTNMTPTVKPPGRHFSSVMYRGNGEIVIFGGNGANQNNFSGARNDLWSFSMDNMAWTQISPGSALPPSRVGHVAAYIPGADKIVVFGGNLSNSSFVNDVWVFDFAPVVGIEEAIVTGAVNLYPNPVESAFNLDFNLESRSDLNIRIVNQLGKIVYKSSEEQVSAGLVQRRIETNGFPAGIYFLDIEGLNIRKKFIQR